MTQVSTLQGRCVLVVEDEYMIACELSEELSTNGAEVIGPVGTVDGARALLDSRGRIDAAILDINLRGEYVFELANELEHRGLPFLFATGYDGEVIPERYHHVVRCEKPVKASNVVAALDRVYRETLADGDQSASIVASGNRSSSLVPPGAGLNLTRASSS